MRRKAAAVFAVLFVAALTVATVTAGDDSQRSPRRIEGIGVQGWHERAVNNRRLINRLHRVLLADPDVVEAINLAAATYGNGRMLWRRVQCESHLNPAAHNASGAAGLYQFIPSTWSSTPYAGFSVFSPYANALAAGWMMGPAGRAGEWSCR